MRRISVNGSSGSGKSTLCRRLADVTGAPHVELDAIFHQPGWTPLPTDEFVRVLGERIAGECWVVDGNYETHSRGIVWEVADTIVWLDLPLGLVMRQVIGRTLRRIWYREELWNGNRERWTNLFDPRPAENVILWSLTRHRRKRRRMLAAMEDPRWRHARFVRLRSHADIDAFVAEVESAQTTQVRQSRG